MDQDVDFDWPWWSIETLLKWIGKEEEEEEGFAEIFKKAERLDFTGERGLLAPRFMELKPRARIPDIDFASGGFVNFYGFYVYVPSYPDRTMPEVWENLLLRAANAKAIWPHGQATRSETHSGMPERPTAGRSGRKPGSGAIDDEDALRRMLEILAQDKAPSVFAAAGMVTKANGVEGASVESIQRRLSRKFAKRHGTEPPSGKMWSDIVG